MPQSHDDAAPMSTSALAAQSLQADVQSGSRDADTSSRASSSTRRTSAYVVPSIASHSQSLRPSLLLSARKTSSKGVASAAAITTAEGALPHSSEPHEPLFPFVIQPSSSSSSMINRSTREGDPESRRDRKHSTSPKGKGKARAADIASERETTAAPDAEGRRYAIDVSPLRTRSRRNSDTSQTSAPTHASSSSSRKSHRSVALSSDGLDDYEQVSIPAVGEQDPRTILREQLARTESFRTTVSSTLKGKGKAIAGHIAEPGESRSALFPSRLTLALQSFRTVLTRTAHWLMENIHSDLPGTTISCLRPGNLSFRAAPGGDIDQHSKQFPTQTFARLHTNQKKL